MKLYIKRAWLLLAIAASALSIKAQNSESGYFLDGYTYRFTTNPAAGNEDNFVSMPGIGNLNLDLRGNLNLNNVLYKRNGHTVLFMHPDVTRDELMKRIDKNNKFNVNLKEQILAFGFKGFGGYNTVAINTNVSLNANVPRSLFELAKDGVTNQEYDISDMDFRANSYAEIALNHSRDIKQVPGLRVGVAVKLLLGIGNIETEINKALVTLGNDNWVATTNANVYSSVNGMTYTQSENSHTGNYYVDDIDFDSFKLNGQGFAFDLGAEYKFNDWKFSAAITDLGFIKWSKTMLASTDGDHTVMSNEYIFSANENATNYAKDEADRLKDDLTRLYELYDKGDIGSRSKSIASTINIGAEYELPVYRKLHFGLLNTTRINGNYSWTEFRLSANVRPVNAFSANANIVCNSYSFGFGWLLNLHVPGFNLFAGMDQTISTLSKQGVPLKSSAQVNFGINFPF